MESDWTGRKKKQFQNAVEKEIEKEKAYRGEGINREWNQLKEAIKVEAKEVYGFQKARFAKKTMDHK